MVLYINKKRNIKLRIAGEQETWQKALIVIIAVLSLVAVVIGAIGIPMFARIKHITIEAGTPISAQEVARDEGASFVGFAPQWTRKPGVYYFTVASNKGEREVRLKVVDTKAPEVVIRDVKCAVGGELPSPEDFLESVNEADECIGEFVVAFSKIDRMGEYRAQVRYYDPSGNSTKIFDVKMSVISDNEAPKINISAETVEIFVGETVDIFKLVTVTDNCVGNIEIEIDDSGVDYSAAGEYTAWAYAKDGVGNASKAKIKIIVANKEA